MASYVTVRYVNGDETSSRAPACVQPSPATGNAVLRLDSGDEGAARAYVNGLPVIRFAVLNAQDLVRVYGNSDQETAFFVAGVFETQEHQAGSSGTPVCAYTRRPISGTPFTCEACGRVYSSQVKDAFEGCPACRQSVDSGRSDS